MNNHRLAHADTPSIDGFATCCKVMVLHNLPVMFTVDQNHLTSLFITKVSSCFLAVLAYRYIINEILPRKAYLTAADKYITFACV